MTTVRDVYDLLNKKAPFALQESWDNSGMLVGHWEQEVTHIFLTLDITPETIQEAEKLGCDLIVSHHPVIFNPVKQITSDNYDGQRLLLLTEHHIAAICCHTSLDASQGGVNDVLAEKCGLVGKTAVLEDWQADAQRTTGIGRVGELAEEMPLTDYLAFLKKQLQPNGIRFYDAGVPVKKVAVGGGSCGSMMGDAIRAGCDTFVTADLKYDHFLGAKGEGINLVDAGHFPTENPVMEVVEQWLSAAFPTVKVTKSVGHQEVISYG
jgi:dinuclear metal center YbgI/SA1388 family protein